MTKIFISYFHEQKKWVRENLVPCLWAGGAEILIDKECFKPGIALPKQVFNTQIQADKHVLVMSPEYFDSKLCRREMNNAVSLDPNFEKGIVIIVIKKLCQLPYRIKKHNVLYVDLCNDQKPDQWKRLLDQCDADLGTDALNWLSARDGIVRHIKKKRSVNLVVKAERVKWRELIEHIKQDYFNDLITVNFENPETAARESLIKEILDKLGYPKKILNRPNDLIEFWQVLSRMRKSKIALIHFDRVKDRYEKYGDDFFAALRHSIEDTRKLVVLIHSRQSFLNIIQASCDLSDIIIRTVEL